MKINKQSPWHTQRLIGIMIDQPLRLCTLSLENYMINASRPGSKPQNLARGNLCVQQMIEETKSLKSTIPFSYLGMFKDFRWVFLFCFICTSWPISIWSKSFCSLKNSGIKSNMQKSRQRYQFKKKIQDQSMAYVIHGPLKLVYAAMS